MNYPVIGQVEMKCGQIVSLLDIPMMSDEKWQQLAGKQAVHNYIRENEREPDSVEDAFKWQREWIAGRTASHR